MEPKKRIIEAVVILVLLKYERSHVYFLTDDVEGQRLESDFRQLLDAVYVSKEQNNRVQEDMLALYKVE